MAGKYSSPLFRKVLEAHDSGDTPQFRLPQKFCLLTVQKNGMDRKFEVQAQSAPSFSPPLDEVFPMKEFAFLDEALAPRGPFVAPLENLPGKVRQFFENGSQLVRIVPLSLISAAKGYLLYPEEAEELEFHSYFSFLGDLVEKCLFETLENRYTPEHLFGFSSLEDLVDDFNEAIAEWLCPTSYQCNGKRVSYFNHSGKSATNLKLQLLDTQEDNPDSIFMLGTHGYPVKNAPDNAYEVDFVEMRKMHLAARLKSFFEHIRRHWEYHRQFQNTSFLSQIGLVISQIDEAHSQASAYQKEMLKVRDTLEEIRRVANEKMREEARQKPLRKQVYPYSFFLSSGGQWRVFFEGSDHSTRPASNQGMASIQYLLSCPDEHITPLDLYEIVDSQGYTYNTSNKGATVDPELDQANLAEAKDIFRQYLPKWDMLKNKPEKKLTREDHAIFQYLIAQIDTIIKFERNRTDLINLRKRTKEKIDHLVVRLGIDPNFANPYSRILKSQQPTGNVKHRTDSLRSNIRRAIGAFEETAPELFAYLEATIILTNRQSNGPGHKPFLFAPGRAPLTRHRNIDWDTTGR